MKVSASILSADFSRLGEEIVRVTAGGADMIHLDVMDGQFVPNITFGPAVVKALRSYSNLPFDTHLMIRSPERFIDDFIKAGSDIITVQVETCVHLQRVLAMIREKGAMAGVSMNPHTPPDFLEYVMDDLDLILVMTVNPGFGGQKFIRGTLPKIRRIRQMIRESGKSIHLQVDGGISPETVAIARSAGADLLVSGSAIFGSEDYGETIKKLKQEL